MQGGYDSMKNVLFRCNFLGFLTLYYSTLLFVKGAESLSQIQKSSSSYSLLVTHALSSTLLFIFSSLAFYAFFESSFNCSASTFLHFFCLFSTAFCFPTSLLLSLLIILGTRFKFHNLLTHE